MEASSCDRVVHYAQAKHEISDSESTNLPVHQPRFVTDHHMISRVLAGSSPTYASSSVQVWTPVIALLVFMTIYQRVSKACRSSPPRPTTSLNMEHRFTAHIL
jgi:hypothetical protein